jgi:hypothetical protein
LFSPAYFYFLRKSHYYYEAELILSLSALTLRSDSGTIFVLGFASVSNATQIARASMQRGQAIHEVSPVSNMLAKSSVSKHPTLQSGPTEHERFAPIDPFAQHLKLICDRPGANAGLIR